jgi:rare lipoprotein A
MGRQTGWTWVPTAHGTIRHDGSFAAVWPTNHIGRFSIRAVLATGRRTSPRAARSSSPLTVTVYRQAIATQYGPGFYGQRTACGQRLTRRMLGVANRTLPCGTKVAIYYHGRTTTVPVIDRGPYANNADWDLTEATGRALGIPGTATIGAVSLPSR